MSQIPAQAQSNQQLKNQSAQKLGEQNISGFQTIEKTKQDLDDKILSSNINILNRQIDYLKHQNDRLKQQITQITETHLIQSNNFTKLKISAEQIDNRKKQLQDIIQNQNKLHQQHHNQIKQNLNTIISSTSKILQTKTQIEKNRQDFINSQQIRTKVEKIQRLDKIVNKYLAKIQSYQSQITSLQQLNTSINKRNQQLGIQIKQIRSQIDKQNQEYHQQKINIQQKYKNIMENLQGQIKNLYIQSNERQNILKVQLASKQQKIQSLNSNIKVNESKMLDRIKSEGILTKKIQQKQKELFIKNTQIAQLKQQVKEHKNEIQTFQSLLRQKQKQLSNKKLADFQEQLNQLNQQFTKNIEDLNSSYLDKQKIHLDKIKTIQQGATRWKNDLAQQKLKFKKQQEKVDLQKNSLIKLHSEQIDKIKSQNTNLNASLMALLSIIDQVRNVLLKCSISSQNYQQIPQIIHNLLQQNIKNTENAKNIKNDLTDQKKQLQNQLQATQLFIKSLNEEVSKIKGFSNLFSTKKKYPKNYVTITEICKFIDLIIQIDCGNRNQIKNQKIVYQNVKKQLFKTQQNEKILILNNKKLSQKLQQTDILNQGLTQQLIKIKFDNQIAINNLNDQIQSLKIISTEQNQTIRQNQAIIKDNQSAFVLNNRQAIKNKELIKRLQSQKLVSANQFDLELKKFSKSIQLKQQEIKLAKSTNQQLTNRIKSLQNQYSSKLNQETKRNELLESKKKQFQQSLQLLKRQLTEKQNEHRLYIQKQIRNICLTFGEVLENQPKGNTFEDIINFIKNNTSNSSDTTFTVSPILQKIPKQRAYLIAQIAKFLSYDKISSTLIYKHDKLNNNFIKYLPQKANNFPFVILLKTKEKQVFGVVSEGLQKKALAFNLNRLVTFEPVQKIPKAPTLMSSNKYLFFGNNQIKITCNQNSVDASIFTNIYGARYFSFNKSDIVGHNQEKEIIALQNLEIHQINP